MNFTDLVDMLTRASSEDAKKLYEKLKEFKDLNEFLAQLPDPERKDILKKITLFAECDAKAENTITYKTKDGVEVKKYDPEFVRMEFVHCDFTGVGYEWDGPHYALVWDVHPRLDSIMVIPTTSQPRNESPGVFPVGRISGLPPGITTMLVSDMTRVSRKRLTPLPPYNHPKKGPIKVKLAQPWYERIREAIAVAYNHENTFEEFLMHKCGVDMVDDLSLLAAWRFKPVRCQYNSGSRVLTYGLWNTDQRHSTTLLAPKKQTSIGLKQQLIIDLFSFDVNVRKAAEARYNDLYK